MKLKWFILNQIMRTSILQSLWEKLHSISMLGMNYFGGMNVDTSGELHVLKTIGKSKNGKTVVFDVGANKGEYTIATKKILNGNTEIYSFEPSAKTFNILVQNLKMIGDDIHPYQLGLSEKDEKLKLFSTVDGSGLSSIYQNNPITTFKQEEEIQLTTLDKFCEEHSIDKIDLLKIDVEGHEYKTLLGAKKLISAGKIDFIQFEFGECNVAARVFLKDFFDLLSNYTFYRILPHGLRKIQYKLNYEVFGCINFLAVRNGVEK